MQSTNIEITPQSHRLAYKNHTSSASRSASLWPRSKARSSARRCRRLSPRSAGSELYSWVAVAYILTSTIMTPIWGKMADLIGTAPGLLRRDGIIPDRLGAVGRCAFDVAVDRLPRIAGAGRRGTVPGRDDHRRRSAPARKEGEDDRAFQRDVGRRQPVRPAGRRLPDRLAVVAMGLLHQPAVRIYRRRDGLVGLCRTLRTAP